MNRLGHFFTPDFKSVGTPGGVAFLNPSGRQTSSDFFIGFFSSSDYAELTEHSCSTDYARNLNGFGLAAIGLARNHCSSA